MNWKRSLVAVFIVVPVVALFGYGLTRDPREIPSPLPGRPAPDFALMPMDAPAPAEEGAPAEARPVRLSDHRGQIVVLNFWASWCLPCRDEHPALVAAAERYQPKGIVFYGVLYNDSPEAARRWLAEMGGQPYPTLLDPGARTAIDYGLYGVPETFFIDREGKVVYKHIGPVTEAILTTWIEEILAGSPGGNS
jgi:cytochrome c biogenesis protein CcmG/thiol:disulfide interchange protein DsbE